MVLSYIYAVAIIYFPFFSFLLLTTFWAYTWKLNVQLKIVVKMLNALEQRLKSGLIWKFIAMKKLIKNDISKFDMKHIWHLKHSRIFGNFGNGKYTTFLDSFLYI